MILLPRPNDYLDWKAWATELIRRLDSNDPVRDVAKALVAGDDITATYDPSKKTIRLSAGISDEVIDDRVAALLTAGANITLTYNDLAGTLTIAASSGATDLGYTASTRVLTSSTGTDVTLPLFTSTEPGLVAASGGGTSNFLRADGSWAAPSGGGSFRGALVWRSTTQSFSAITYGVMSWDTADYDTDSIWSAGNPTRLTVPSGVTRVRLVANFEHSNTSNVLIEFRKNQTTAGAATRYPGLAATAVSATYNTWINLVSPVLTVTAGDWFDLGVNCNNAGSAQIKSTWMAMEIIA